MSLTEGLSKGLSLPSVSRRGFLEVNAKLAALAGAGSMAVSNAPKVFAMGTVGRPSVEAGPAGQLGEERMYYNSDTLNCMGQRCVHKIYVKDGRITRVETDTEGDPWDAWECPQMRSCVKGRGKKLEVYSPDRVKYPLERTGPRGSGQFRRVSWKYALDRMASELMRIKNSYGPQAILMHSFCNIIGGTKMAMAFPLFILPNVFGPITTLYSDTSGGGTMEGIFGPEGASMGEGMVDSRVIAENSNLVIILGSDPAVTQMTTNTMFRLLKMKKRLAQRGVKVVGIDPKLSLSLSALADEWIPIRHQTDPAMLAAMAYTIIQEGLLDKDILDRFTYGYKDFEAYVLGQAASDDPEAKRWADGVAKTPEWAEKICGVPASKIRELAIDLGTKKPAAILYGIGPGHGAIGDRHARMLTTLAFMTGNVGKPGTACWPVTFNLQPIPLKYLVPAMSPGLWWGAGGGGLAGLLGLTQLFQVNAFPAYYAGRVLNNPGEPLHYGIRIPEIRAIVDIGNLMAKWVDVNDLRRGFQNPRIEFISEIELQMTTTAKYSDIVMPVVSSYEKEDFTSLIHGFAPGSMYMQKAIEPLWECKEDYWIWHELAKRWGIGHVMEANPSFDQAMRNTIALARAVDPDHPTYEEMKSGKKALYKGKFAGISLKAAFDNQINKGMPFGTPSGKYEIHSQWIEKHTDGPVYRNMTWVDNDFPGWRDMKVRVPAVPTYTPHWEGWEDPLRAKYPYQCIQNVSQKRAHTCFANNRLIEDVVGPEDAWINPADAETKGVKTGDVIEIFNDRGRARFKAFVTNRIVQGNINVAHGKYAQWNEQGVEMGGEGNVLTKQEFTGTVAKMGILTMWLSAPAWGTALVDFVKVADADPSAEEKDFRQEYYTFQIDGTQQGVENVSGEFIKDLTWQAEKGEGKTADANVQASIGQTASLNQTNGGE